MKKSGMQRPITVNGKKALNSAVDGEKLQTVLKTLEACQQTLASCGSDDAARIVQIAVLQLRLQINGLDAEDLFDICTAIAPDAGAASPARRS